MIRQKFAVLLIMTTSLVGTVLLLSANPSAAASKAKSLVGTFKLNAGSCQSGTASGTYFRMIFPNGTVAKGKFFDNPDSLCTDKTYTLAVPGSQGGLVTGKYQPNPVPPFNAQGGALASAIVEPQSFTAIDFSIATDKTDPQTGKAVPPPSISAKGSKLSGQIEAWSASWNKLYFNQGSPKPGGSHPGLTAPLTGTYNAKSHAFVITWTSQVVGGPFNGFTGYWHLAGTFVPAK
jgi:hypothetical protein